MERCDEYVSRYSVCKNCNNEVVDCGREKCPVYKAPTADVVPRAEIESTLKYSKDTIKTEVARDIFEEMQVLLMLRMGVNEVIAELKKKYTEEKT